MNYGSQLTEVKTFGSYMRALRLVESVGNTAAEAPHLLYLPIIFAGNENDFEFFDVDESCKSKEGSNLVMELYPVFAAIGDFQRKNNVKFDHIAFFSIGAASVVDPDSDYAKNRDRKERVILADSIEAIKAPNLKKALITYYLDANNDGLILTECDPSVDGWNLSLPQWHKSEGMSRPSLYWNWNHIQVLLNG